MLNFFVQHTIVEGDYNLKDIKVVDEIGRGNSHVYTAFIRNELYAMKQIEIKSDYEYQSFLREISYMKQLSEMSRDLIKYYGYFVTYQEMNQYCQRRYAHIVMECAEMNLQNFIAYQYGQGKRFSKNQIIQIIDFLLNAFTSLQKNKIAHCDIKPENILILNSKQLTMKICDVGSSKIIDSDSVQEATVLGTLPFLAPELVKIKSNKIVSANVFKSDVFSFGLVILYIITNKKFSSKERIQIPQPAYFQVISEWIKEAREIVNYDSRITEVLRCVLQFQEFKRPLFNDVKTLYEAQKKKNQTSLDAKKKKLSQQDSERRIKLQQQYYTSLNPTSIKKVSPFKGRIMNKTVNRTTSIGFPRINKNFQKQVSPPGNQTPMSPLISPLVKRQSMCFTNTSPEKANNSIIDYKRIIYITEDDKEYIPFQYVNQEEKIFILLTPCQQITKAESISIYEPCPLATVYNLIEVEVNKLYLQYQGFEGTGVDISCPNLKIKKIYANFRGAQLIGGYKYLLRSFCSSQLQYLQLDITNSDISFDEITDILDRLNGKSLKYLGIIWENNILSPDQHSHIIQKISKIMIKKLTFIMNDNFIKYQKQSRWALPKNCQILYLQYTSNFLQKIIPNLSISISKCSIKQLYLNFNNNNLNKSEANMLFKSVSSVQTLQKLILNLSWNPISDISYIITSLKDLAEVSSLQLKLHHAGISEQQIFEAISQIKCLFDGNLKILKVTYDRNLRKKQFQQRIEKALNGSKILKIDVLGYDNKYLMAFIKKTSKLAKSKATTTRLKGQNTNLLGFKPVIEEKQSKKAGSCLSLYSNNRNYDNYVCLTCSDFSELSKTEYFCKFCIENCKHKGHNIVKIYERAKCCCAYSGTCSSQIAKRVCAQNLKISYKSVYKCFKCEKRMCQGCISRCLEFHKEWVEHTKINIIFKCGSPI